MRQKKGQRKNRKLEGVFAVESIDAEILANALEMLLSAINRYNTWVEKHGFRSPATAEGLLNWVFDAWLTLNREVGYLRDDFTRATECQTGLAYLLKILIELCDGVLAAIPRRPDDFVEPISYPGFARILPGMEPFQFEPAIVDQLELSLDTIRGWLEAPTGGANAAGPLESRERPYASVDEPVPERYQLNAGGTLRPIGPITGNQTELAWAVDGREKREPRDRHLKRLHGGKIWVQEIDGIEWNVFFVNARDQNRAAERLADFRKQKARPAKK